LDGALDELDAGTVWVKNFISSIPCALSLVGSSILRLQCASH
jgi:hypothetical protein